LQSIYFNKLQSYPQWDNEKNELVANVKKLYREIDIDPNIKGELLPSLMIPRFDPEPVQPVQIGGNPVTDN
jgi:hypothetical protein